MNNSTDNNKFEDHNSSTESLDNVNDKNSEQSLVEDLKDSLRESVDESLNTLNYLMQEIQEKVEDDSIKEETQKIVSLLSENILNPTSRDVDDMGHNINLQQSNPEEE
jgi:hypothetical protein